MNDYAPFAPEWTEAEREEYKRAYMAGEPVLLAHFEHDAGECEHCDLLRQLQREAEDEADA